MLKPILVVIGALITLLGVIMIYDARKLTKKLFGFGDQNEATAGMKIFGFIIAIAGALMIFFLRKK